MSDFDFIKGFVDVNLLEAEAVSRVVGHVVASLFNGMVEAGLSDDDAHRIIRAALAEMWRSLRPDS